MSTENRSRTFLTILAVGLALGVTLGILGNVLDLSRAVVGGITGGLIAVIAMKLRKQQ